jgi:hypothetical protein
MFLKLTWETQYSILETNTTFKVVTLVGIRENKADI